MVINMSWQNMTKTQDVGMLPACQGDKGLQVLYQGVKVLQTPSLC